MDTVKIEDVFHTAFVSVSNQLLAMELQRQREYIPVQNQFLREVIYTIGEFEAFIMCEMEKGLYEDILLRMHGGTFPKAEDRSLYLNEYMNIVCGQAISAINNQLGTRTRLSVPQCYEPDECIVLDSSKKENRVLYYAAQTGAMKVTIQYTLGMKRGG